MMGEEQMFLVLDGGRCAALNQDSNAALAASMVSAEARRRLEAAGLDRYEARERLTGTAVPLPLRHYKMKIDFAVEALSTLSPLPTDFVSDTYWPDL